MAAYAEFLVDVAAVQVEERLFLQALVKKRYLKGVHREALTPELHASFLKSQRTLKDWNSPRWTCRTP